MFDVQSLIEDSITGALTLVFGESFRDVNPLVRPAANRRFGDYQADLAMGLAKRVGITPREIAQRIARQLQGQSLFESVTVAGPGFINMRLAQALLEQRAQALLTDERMGVAPAASSQKVVVDYSSPNVAKEMHVGHLRSTIIGDAIARVLEFQGHSVVRQNHVGDWGTQFGMLIEYLFDRRIDTRDAQDIGDLNALYQESKRVFDTDANFAERARRRVVKLQAGDTATIALWQQLVAASERHFQEVYTRLDVKLQPDDVRGESFYNDRLGGVIEDLGKAGLLHESEGALVVYPVEFKDRDGNAMPMIVRKGDGGYPYATTDLAAARYRISEVGAQRIIYVTDVRQRDHFAMVFALLRQARWAGENVRLDHVPFGTVLGKDRKPFKTRSGGTVRLIELMDEARRRAAEVIRGKNPEMPAIQQEAIAGVVGMGALKYADLSSDRIKDYVFDWDNMLALEGNTAPYLQNAYVRIRAIFRKGGIDTSDLHGASIHAGEPQERALLLQLFKFPRVLAQVAEALEPHQLCGYLYDLAVHMHQFYERCPVLGATGESVRVSRLALCHLVARTLELGLGLLGIAVVAQM